jgi:hypothetical protein
MESLHVRLPCCHRTVYPPAVGGEYWRGCRRCGRRFLLELEQQSKGIWVVTIVSELEYRLLRQLEKV